MALGPIDYSQAGQVRPVQAADFLGGLNAGIGLGEVAVVREQELQAQRAAQMKQQQDAARQAEIRAATLEFAKNPTVTRGTQLAALYPEMGEHFRKTIDVLEPQEKQARITQMSTALAAAQAARKKGEPPAAASGYLRQQATAYRNSEREEDAKSLENFAALVDSNPNEAEATMILALSGALGPEQAAKAFETYSSTGANVEKTQAETAKLGVETDIKRVDAKYAEQEKLANIALTNQQRSLIARQTKAIGEKFALDWAALAQAAASESAKIEAEAGKMPADVFKAQTEYSVAAQALRGGAERTKALALRLKQSGAGSGLGSRAGEWFKQLTGSEDEISALRRQFEEMKSRSVVENLPAGSASDRDIELFSAGWPSGDAKNGAEFLEALGRIQEAEASMKSDQAEFMGRNHNFGPAKRDLNINGVVVPAGTTYNQFAQQRGEQRRVETSVQSATPEQRNYFTAD